jgi:dihydroflavonol-4-reductase
MKVFITGATGFIGKAIVERIIARNLEVTALVRNPESGESKYLSSKGVTLLKGDILDQDSLSKHLTGFDLVIHNAGSYAIGITKHAREQMNKINVEGTANVLKSAHEAKIPKTVYISTALVYGSTGDNAADENYTRQQPSHSFYETSKTEAHEIALSWKNKGLPLVIVCPNGVIGANDHSAFGYFLRWYLTGTLPPIAWAKDMIQNPVHVDDLAEGIVLVAEKGRLGEIYLLAGEPTTRKELFGLWEKFGKRGNIHLWLSDTMAHLMLAPAAPFLRAIGLPAFLSNETISAGIKNLYYSPAKAIRELGWHYRSADEAWKEIIVEEKALMKHKKGWIEKLKPQSKSE